MERWLSEISRECGRNTDLRLFMSSAAFFSAAVIFRFDLPVLKEVASFGSFMILTFFLSPTAIGEV